MKLISAISIVFMCSMLHSSSIFPLPDDSFTSQEKADEAAKIINQNFQNLWNDKVDVGTNSLGSPSYFVGDLLDPDQADYNAWVIQENADDLWRNKAEASGGTNTNGRVYDIVNLEDPDNVEENLAAIDQIFFDLDSSKAE